MDTDDHCKLKESPALVDFPQEQEDEMSVEDEGKKVAAHDVWSSSITTYRNPTGTIDDDNDNGRNGNDDEDTNDLSSATDAVAATTTTTAAAPPPPPPRSKFKVFDKVIARDKDGLMYDAVIRRCLYGSSEAQQIPIGLFTNAEAEAILKKRREQEQKLAAAAASSSQEEGEGEPADAAAAAAAASEPPAWHYFVHYNKWNVNWDRWVSQYDVYEPTEKVQQYAARIIQEHKNLSNQLASKCRPGKKKFQTIDGNTFLSQWRLRLERIDAEMEMYNPLISPFSTTTAAASIMATTKSNKGSDGDVDDDDDKKSKKGKRAQSDTTSSSATIDGWSKATLTAEMQHRNEHNLTMMRQSSIVAAKKLVLPFALHKILVDQWEIISQCGMLPALPAPVTVRQVLDRYLASKQIIQPEQEQPAAAATVAVRVYDVTEKTTTIDAANVACSATKNSTTCTIRDKNDTSSPSPMAAKSHPSNEKSEGTVATTASPSLNESQASLPKIDSETSTQAKQDEEATLEPKEKEDCGSGKEDDLKGSLVESSSSCSADIPQEFIEMAEGIASFFDQALPTRLLYRQEIPQLRVLDAILPEEYHQKRLSEIYGGEHLLRLFIRLPEALVDGFAAKAAAAAAKSKNTKNDTDAVPLDPTPRIFALLSDFARFLHKHQSTLFCQSHRKWTAVELKEQQKMNARQQRRKERAVQQQQEPVPAATNTSTSKQDVVEGKKEADSSEKSKSPALSSQEGRKRRKMSQ
jgi:MRG/RNA binding activity-knot of a chromodomain